MSDGCLMPLQRTCAHRVLGSQKGQKCVQLDSAVGMWRLLLESPHAGPNAWSLVDDWVAFLEARHSNRAIAKDTWQQLLDFIKVRDWPACRAPHERPLGVGFGGALVLQAPKWLCRGQRQRRGGAVFEPTTPPPVRSR